VRQSATVANPDRLSGLDASFLALEKGGAHMHVGSVLVFDGESPDYEQLLELIESRLHLVPRYRQKLAFPPLAQARPVWVDDPHFNVGYHVRHTALPAPAGEAELRRLAGRVFAQQLDRSKPLWEIWLVDGVGEDRFALVCKTHHALVDGISGVDIMAVLFDLEPEPPERDPGPAWYPRPEPSGSALFADALVERAATPLDAVRAAAGVLTAPREAADQAAPGSRRWRPPGWAALRRARSIPASARTGGSPGWSRSSTASRRSRPRSAAPSTTWCWPS
jgi:diacylglycerol O-acyltransferase